LSRPNFLVVRDIGSPIFYLAYSSDATKLGIASQSSVAMCLKLPRTNKTREGKPNCIFFIPSVLTFILVIIAISFMGHNNGITHISFSYLKLSTGPESQYQMLTSSNDYSARLWKLNRNDVSSIIFSHHKHHSHPDSSSSTTLPTIAVLASNSSSAKQSSAKRIANQRNRPFSSEVKNGQFFYQDRFVLFVSGFSDFIFLF
jgi:WD40 repeat protein